MNREPTELPCTSKFSPVIPDLQSGRVSAGARLKNRRNSLSLLPNFPPTGAHLQGVIVSVLCLSSHKPHVLLRVLFPERGLCSQHFCGIFFLARQVPWDFCLSETHPADSSWKVFYLLPPGTQTRTLFLINVSISKHFRDACAGDPRALSSCFPCDCDAEKYCKALSHILFLFSEYGSCLP